MRVLVVHNRYRQALPSGENAAVDAEIEWLRASGVEVVTYFRSSDEISGFSGWQQARLAYQPVVSRQDGAALRSLIRRTRPHVMHVHNVFPLISPWALRVAAEENLPTAMTVHNYRLMCAKGTMFRDGHRCHDCTGRAFAWPAIAHGCYRESRAQSIPIATALSVHRKTWRGIGAFLAPSEHVARFLRGVGMPADRIHIKGNGIDDPGPARPPGHGFLYLGRLDEEKGIGALLEAWRDLNASAHQLTVAGDGPLRPLVEEHARRRTDIRFVGPVPSDRAMTLLGQAAVLIAPSLCEETFGRTIVEALARGRPAVVTDLGGASELVDASCGWVVEPTAPGVQAGIVASTTADLAEMGRAARARFEERYTSDRTGEVLLGVYEQLRRQDALR